MKDFSAEASGLPRAFPPEAGAPAPVDDPGEMEAADGAGASARSPSCPASRAADVLECHRQQIDRLLAAGQRYRAMHALLNATSMGCLDRALLLKLCALARELSLGAESAEAMALALDEGLAPEGELLCLLGTRLFCREGQFAQADALLAKAAALGLAGARLDRRCLFTALRAGDGARSAAALGQAIARARKAGDRRAAARFSQWLGHLLGGQGADLFRAAECHARAAALYKALEQPQQTFRAQREALLCLSRIAPRPRQLGGAIRALWATARAAGRMAEAEGVLRALGLADGSTSPGARGARGLDDVFEQAIAAAGSDADRSLPADEQQTKPLRRDELEQLCSASVAPAERPPPLPEAALDPPMPAGQDQESPQQAGAPGDPAPALPPAAPAAGRFLSFFREAEQEALTRGACRERQQLERHIDRAPFDAEVYRALAAHCARQKREEHARLISDAADALEGHPVERSMPPLTLNEEDWALFQHPQLGALAHELGLLVGQAIIDVTAEPIDAFQPRGTFSMDGSDGAWALADALLCAVRVLGVRVADIRLSRDGALPIFPVCSTPPALFVSKPLLKKKIPSALLRFFAGRGLASLRPELGMFLLVPPERIDAALAGIRKALKREGRMSEHTRAVVQRVSGKSADRLGWLLDRLPGAPPGDLAQLCAGARHTVNRLGLIAAGGIGPALQALDFEGAGEAERAELLRFAISKGYRDRLLRGR